MPTRTILLIAVLLCLSALRLRAQEGEKDKATPITEVPQKTFTALTDKSQDLEGRLNKATDKYLDKLLRQEGKLRRKLFQKDSTLAHQLFDGIDEKYAALKTAPQKLSRYSGVYSGHLDSLTTALSFLKGGNLTANPELQKTLTQFATLKDKLAQTEAIKKFIQERKQLLKDNLGRLDMLGDLSGFQKQAYYYAARLRDIKAVWEDPSKLEKKLMELVLRSDQFKNFFRQHSQLASLFALPGRGSGSGSTASLQGLQTRASVQGIIAARFGTGPQVQQQLQQAMQEAQGKLHELKSKMASLGSGAVGNTSGDVDLPQGFKPNTQKTKTFLQRLEYGANIQSQKSSSFLPTTSDIGLSLGYKLNDKSAIGVGASYKLGWGRGIQHIRMSSEGLGLRSYVDYQLKGSLYISGGYEQNYRTAFRSIEELKNGSAWQSSGLLGLSKKYKVSKKLKGDMKLLWDFLSYQQLPRTQAIVFRIGYNLK